MSEENWVPIGGPIQGSGETYLRRKADTELARAVAANKGWRFDGDQAAIVDTDGIRIAASIEELARAVRALGWLAATSDGGSDVGWGAIPESQEAANAVRTHVGLPVVP